MLHSLTFTNHSLLFWGQLVYTSYTTLDYGPHLLVFLLLLLLCCCQCVKKGQTKEQGYKHGYQFRMIPHDWMAQLTQSVQVVFRMFLPRSTTSILCAYQLLRNCCSTTISLLWLVMTNSNGSHKVANDFVSVPSKVLFHTEHKMQTTISNL